MDVQNESVAEWVLGIVTLILATVSAVVYRKADGADSRSSQTELRLRYVEAELQAFDRKFTLLEATVNKVTNSLSSLEAYGKSQDRSLRRIEAALIRRQHPHETVNYEDEEGE